MSTATAEKPAAKASTKGGGSKPKMVRQHPPARKKLLKKAGLSEGTEMDERAAKALDGLPESATPQMIEAIVKGDGTGKSNKGGRGPATKYPEPIRVAYQQAIKLTGSPDEGGPKYPLTVKQTAAIDKALASKAKATAEVNEGVAGVSDSALKKIAQGKKDAPKAATAAVRAFLKAHPTLNDDRTMYARKGAAIVLALRVQGKAS